MTFVLLVWGGQGVGGTESRMAEVISAWRSADERVISVMLSSVAGTPLHRLLLASGSEVVLARDTRRLFDLVAHQRPRLVIAFGLRSSLIVRALRLAPHIGWRPWPGTLDARNGLEAGRGRIAWLIDRSSQRLIDRYLANSDAAAATLLAHGIAKHRVRVLYSALGEAWQSGISSEPREPASVVMVGNARPEKQHHLGLELFARLSEPARLVVYTNDASGLRQQWADLAGSSPGTAEFHEGAAVTPDDLRRAAVVLHPSSHESAPRCLMEARASGCQVVAFDVGDIRRIVGGGGEIVPAGDVDQLSAALERTVRASAAGTLPHSPGRFPSVPSYVGSLDAIGANR